MARISVLPLFLVAIAATFCRAQVSIEENQLSVCLGQDAVLAICTTNGTDGLVWHFPGHPDVRYQPSTTNLTQERMNEGSVGVFVFTLESRDIQADVYISSASVRNIQLTDNGTSLACAESNLQKPKTIVVLVQNCSSSAVSSTIATVSSPTVVVVPDRSTVNTQSFSSVSSTPSPAGPTDLPVNAVAIAVPIVLILLILLIVIVTVIIVVLLLVRRRGRREKETIEMYKYNNSPNLGNVAQEGTAPVPSAVNPAGLTSSSSQSPIYDEVDDKSTNTTDGKENEHSKEQDNESDNGVFVDAYEKTAAELLEEEKMGHQEAETALENYYDSDNSF